MGRRPLGTRRKGLRQIVIYGEGIARILADFALNKFTVLCVGPSVPVRSLDTARSECGSLLYNEQFFGIANSGLVIGTSGPTDFTHCVLFLVERLLLFGQLEVLFEDM